ncbi:MAG: tripartite tricarboxylate transporter substrate binding protein [Enhydrobacter sp.]|nr:tripartite tricarboxylate transporter substrate binding protein [Enhydrobacter sp.]
MMTGVHASTYPRLVSRRTAGIGIAAAVLSTTHGPAVAQEFPNRAITVVCPFGPGTAIDIIGRQLAQHMTGTLGQSVIVDNRPGATGNIATDYVAKAAPNGYTIYITSTSIIVNQFVGAPASSLTRDFEPIAISGTLPYAILVPTSLPAQTLQELVALAKARPGKLNYAGYVGGVPQFLGEMLNRTANVNIVMVPYKSTTDAANDFIADRIQVLFTPVPSGLPFQAGKQGRIIAVTGEKRATILPDVPTTREAGFPDLAVEVGFFFLAPAGTPKPIVERLSSAIATGLHDPKVWAALAAQGVEKKEGGPDETRAYLAAELRKWEAIVKQSAAAAK